MKNQPNNNNTSANSSKGSQNNNLNNTNESLKGDKLLSYIESNKSKFNNDGDALCIQAGYGYKSEEGKTICRLDLFSNELIAARQVNYLNLGKNQAREEILKVYDANTLKGIAEGGCLTGIANLHLQIKDLEVFYDKHDEEIELVVENSFGKGYIEQIAKRGGNDSIHWKHRAVWKFIEIVASDEINK